MQRMAWAVYAFALLVAPWIWGSSMALSVLSQMGYAIIMCLSYNVLFGQGGMLSFGHAVYTGLGGFVAVHAMNAGAQGHFAIPLVCVPLVGGLGSLLAAAVLGWVSTRKSGTTFAMITLGVGELVAALALMWPGLFGGEGGITSDRVYGEPLWGISFGPAIEVYYLIACYCLLCTIALYAWTTTPLGRMLNAVRDNPERVAFMGYNPQRVRYMAFMVAGFFAGIGGALAAINLEIVTAADSFSMARSGAYLLFTFIGGSAFFCGPILGAVLMVLTTVLLSEWTQAWAMYLGLFFMLTVLYAPKGLAGWVISVRQQIQHSSWRCMWPRYAGMAAMLVPMVLAAAVLIEMLYHRQLQAATGPQLRFAGCELDVTNASHWLAASAVLLVSGAGFLWLQRRAARCGHAQPQVGSVRQVKEGA